MSDHLKSFRDRISDPQELAKDWFSTSCRCVIHPHEGSCNNFFSELWWITFKSGVSMYTPMYLITSAISNPNPKLVLKRAIPAIIRSTLFLSIYTGGYGRILCYLINRFGHSRFVYWLAPFLASIVTFYIEKPQRRRELSVFMVNQGVENMFKMLLSRGYLAYTPFETSKKLLFALSVAVLMYFVRWEPDNMSPTIRTLIKTLMASEDKDWLEEKVQTVTSPLLRLQVLLLGDNPNKENGSMPFEWDTRRCLFLLNGFIRGFTIGYTAKVTLSFMPKIFKPMKLIQNFQKITSRSFGKSSFQFGLFVSLLVGVPRLIKIILTTLLKKDHPLIDIVSGFLGGISTMILSSTEFTMYLLSKAIECVVYALISRKIVPTIPMFENIVYSLGAASLFYSGSWEPWTVRPSYLNFVAKMSGNHYSRFSECDALRSMRIKTGMEDLHQEYIKLRKP